MEVERRMAEVYPNGESVPTVTAFVGRPRVRRQVAVGRKAGAARAPRPASRRSAQRCPHDFAAQLDNLPPHPAPPPMHMLPRRRKCISAGAAPAAANNAAALAAAPKPDAAPDSKDPPAPAPDAIIALPCAHVFHAACLGPWFARPGQTTCPTCRFDLDPAGLIWYAGRKGAPRAFDWMGMGAGPFGAPAGAGPFGAPAGAGAPGAGPGAGAGGGAGPGGGEGGEFEFGNVEFGWGVVNGNLQDAAVPQVAAFATQLDNLPFTPATAGPSILRILPRSCNFGPAKDFEAVRHLQERRWRG
ncbi:hypothetical protein FB451DRAFT_1454396 [Mycena latifolia]|nr:hypothetical protein FB451DRAFT_1454396 [Mycena latifolia]